MNSFHVFLNRDTTVINTTNQRKPETLWQNGQTFTAVLESVNNGTATLRAEGDVLFTADASSIQGQVGDNLTFLVRRTQQGYELTQLTDRPADILPRGRATSMDAIKEFSHTMDSIKENNELRAEYRQEQNLKIARAIAAIRRSQSFMASTAGKSAVAAIVNSGLDLTKVSFAILDKIMHHIDRQPTQPTEEDKRFFTRKNGETIVLSLHKQGLPVSERNISHMERAWNRLPVTMPEPVIEHLVTSEEELTLENVHKYHYPVPNNYPKDLTKPKQTRWNNHLAAVEKLFADRNIPPQRENFLAAQFLFVRDLPITKENIERVLLLKQLPENINNETFREVFFDQAAVFIARDRPLGTLSLPEILRMAEVQLKITQQAAIQHQDLHINTDIMRDNLRRLTLQEAETYIKIADIGTENPNPTTTNPNSITPLNPNETHEPTPASRLVSVFDTLANLRPLTANVHVNIINNQIPFTISGIDQSLQAARVNTEYEQNATVPNPRYGDSFSQVRTQFTPLLTGMGITPTEEYLKASFILSKNKMDVTLENLHAVKEIETKIAAITNKLHPMIAAKMITEGLNPLTINADQMLAYIKQFNYDMGENGAQKLARYIYETDEDKSIDGDTRKTMIAIYRMLHVIQKDGAAALGLAAQLNTPLTLGGLYNLALNRHNRKHTDISVNDSLGELEHLIRPEGNIRATIESGTTKHTLSHMDIVTDLFTDLAQPTALEKLLQTTGSLEQSLEDLAAAEKSPVPKNITAASEQIQAFVSANPETIYKLLNRNISTRLNHIKAADNINENPSALENDLNLVLEETNDDDNGESREILYNAIPASNLSALTAGQSPGQILAQIRAALGEEHRIQPLIAVTHGFNEDIREGFSLPIRINGRVSHLNMYVLNDRALTADDAKIVLSLDTARLGRVTAYFTLNPENGLDAVISAQTPAAFKILETLQDELLSFAQQANVKISGVEFIHE